MYFYRFLRLIHTCGLLLCLILFTDYLPSYVTDADGCLYTIYENVLSVF